MTVAKPMPSLKSSRFPRHVLVTDSLRLADPLPSMLRLKPGDGVLFRHYDHPQRLQIARQVAVLCRKKRLFLLVAEDWRLAARLRADGVHLPQYRARHGILSPVLGWRKRSGKWLGMACHDRQALGRAGRLRLDYAILSPVFATASHPGASGLGAGRFASWAARASCPVLAMGGITPYTARQLRFAHGFAAIGAFLP